MCLEDLRISRGKFPKRGLLTGTVATKAALIGADPNRTAIILTFNGQVLDNAGITEFDSDTVTIFSETVNGSIPIAVLNAYLPMVILRIEDLGQVITGAISYTLVTFSTQGPFVGCIPIVTDLNPPIMDGSRKT